VGWAAPLLYRVDIGQWDDAVVTSFYDSEYGAGTTFRWSEPRATLQLPAVGAGAYVVRLHASALAATTLDITLQNTTQTVLVQPGFAYYDVAVQVPIGWRDTLSVTLAVAQPQVVARRSIGVALDEVRVIPNNWQIPAWHGVWWTLFATLVLTHLLRFWRIAWVWRWLAAAALTMAVVVLRHGNAATILELLAMLGSLAIVQCTLCAAHTPPATRRRWTGCDAGAAGVVVAWNFQLVSVVATRSVTGERHIVAAAPVCVAPSASMAASVAGWCIRGDGQSSLVAGGFECGDWDDVCGWQTR
jgi:hypothetical protein